MPAVLIRRTVRRPASLAPAVEASCLALRSRVAMTVPIQVLANAPLPDLAGHIASSAVLSGHARTRRNMAGEISSSGALAGAALARLALTGHVTATSDLSGASAARLAVSGALVSVSAINGASAARLALSGGLGSHAALAGAVSGRLALMGSVAAGAVLSGTPSTGSTPDPLRGGWDTSALDAGILTFTNNDRTVTSPGSDWPSAISKASFSTGKVYLSVRVDANEYGGIGINTFDKAHELYYGWDGQIYSSDSGTFTYISNYDAPCDIDVAINADAHLVWFRLNGGNWNSSGTADPATGVGGFSLPGTGVDYYVQVGMPYFAGSQRTLNTGTAAFTYPPPAGFLPLLT